MPPNPPSNAHGFAMRSMSLRDMQIPKSEKKNSCPPLPNPGDAPVYAPCYPIATQLHVLLSHTTTPHSTYQCITVTCYCSIFSFFIPVVGMCQGWGQVQLTKYSSTPSTPNIYQVQVLVKYSFF